MINVTGGSQVGRGINENDESVDYADKHAGGACDYVSFGLGGDGEEKRLLDEFDRLESSLEEGDSFGNMGSYPFVDWVLSPGGLSAFDETWNKKEWVEFSESQDINILEEGRKVVRVNDFKLKNGSLIVSGGDVVLFVDGDFELGKGGSSYEIEDGSSLTVFVKGKTDIAHGVKMDDSKTLGSEGSPRLSIFSSGEDVDLKSSSKGVASVYAPYSDVSINSGGQFFGSLRGKTLKVTGGGLIAYDIALASEGPTSVGEGGDPEIKSWR